MRMPAMPTGMDSREMWEHWIPWWTKVGKLILAIHLDQKVLVFELVKQAPKDIILL